MPWTVDDVEKHYKGLSAKDKKKWVAIANAVLKTCLAKDGTNCDAMAIRTANSRIKTNTMMNVYGNSVKEYTTREETLNGREYIVVPVTMMVEGVHAGSHGPLLHTAEELGKIPESWNGIPVTVGHPIVDGSPVSANSPEILEQWAIGIIFNTEMNSLRLKSEAWLEKSKLANHENLNDRINNGEIIEVSVGVFSEDEETEGVWHNEQYSAIARNLRPDHLAILPNQIGACSTEDGCGIRINSKNMKDEEAVNQLKQQGYIVSELVVNESLMQRIEKVREAVYHMDGPDIWCYVEDVDENFVIYSKSGKDIDSKLYKQGYAIAANDSIEFVGDPVEVKRKVEYETVMNTNTVVKRTRRITNFKKEDVMSSEKCTPCVEKKVTELIANVATKYTEKDREWLETLEEGQLDSMVPIEVQPTVVEKVEKITPEMAVNALKEGLKTDEDWLKIMPEKTREQMRSAMKLHESRKQTLIQGILDNTEKDVWTKEELEVYEVEKLEKLAKTAGIKQDDQILNYVGMAAGAKIQDNAQEDDVPLLAPAGIEFTKIKEGGK